MSGGPAGAGWDWLVLQARSARFTLIGRRARSRGNGPVFSGPLQCASWIRLHPSGGRTFSVIAEDVEASARLNGLQGIVNFLNAPGTFTFYNLREEAQFLADVIRTRPEASGS
jgi:hypothetical protein